MGTTYAAVMVTYRRPDWLGKSIGAVLEQTSPPAVLVVVDNDDDPDVRRCVEELAVPDTILRYAPSSSNLGPAGGLQQGLEVLAEIDPEGRMEHVLFLDDDDPLEAPDTVARLLEFRGEFGRQAVGGVGILGARWDSRRARLRRIADAELAGPVLVDYIGGGQAPLYDRRALDAVGGVDPSLFFGFDDLDLGFRLKRAGYGLYAHGEMFRLERVRRDHIGRPPYLTRRWPEVPWRTYYSARNLVLILRAQRCRRQAVQVTLQQIAGGLRRHSALRPRLRGLFDGWAGRRGARVLPR